MLTVKSATRSINRSMKRITKTLGIEVSTARKRYFGISIKQWIKTVLLANQTEFTLDNYGRSKKWVIAFAYWRNLTDLHHMNLELEQLLHHTMWDILPVQRQIRPSIAYDRSDYIAVKRLDKAFDVVYRALFVETHGKRHKYSKINKLVREMLQSQGFPVKCKQIRYLFAQYNHIVIKHGHLWYYNNLNFSK